MLMPVSFFGPIDAMPNAASTLRLQAAALFCSIIGQSL